MLLELLLEEEEELSEAAMEALRRSYNLHSRDAEVHSLFLLNSCRFSFPSAVIVHISPPSDNERFAILFYDGESQLPESQDPLFFFLSWSCSPIFYPKEQKSERTFYHI